MTIIETTPPLVERTFSLNLTENELKILGIALGKTIPNQIKDIIVNGDWIIKMFPHVKWDADFIQNTYDKILELQK